VGRLRSGPRFVGRIGSAVGVTASSNFHFKNVTTHREELAPGDFLYGVISGGCTRRGGTSFLESSVTHIHVQAADESTLSVKHKRSGISQSADVRFVK